MTDSSRTSTSPQSFLEEVSNGRAALRGRRGRRPALPFDRALYVEWTKDWNDGSAGNFKLIITNCEVRVFNCFSIKI